MTVKLLAVSKQCICRILIGVVALVATGVASAQVTYTYTGKNFTSFLSNCCVTSSPTGSNPYSSSDFVSGSFMVNSALTDGSHVFGIDLPGSGLSFSFSDGRLIADTAGGDAGTVNGFLNLTVLSGTITNWYVNINVLESPYSWVKIRTQWDGNYGTDFGSKQILIGGPYSDINTMVGIGTYDQYRGGVGDGVDGYVPGTWAMAAAVPEPETYAMLLAGLGFLGFMARRRRKNQAA